MRRLSVLLAAVLALGAVVSAPARSLRIALVPKEASGEFWDAIHAGAVKAARDLSKGGDTVTLAWMPPAGKGGPAAQSDAVFAAAATRPDALVIAPIDPETLKPTVESAARNGLPVIVIDTLLSSPLVTAYVGTNNYQAGQEGAGLLGKLMKESGGVLVVGDFDRYPNVAQREKGFIQGLNIYPNVQPLYSGDYAASMPAVSTAAAAKWLRQFGPKVGGVFTTDAASYAAVTAALKESGQKVVFVAAGSSRAQVEALRSGAIQGLVAESPFEIGFQGVQAAAAALAGKQVPPRNSIPFALLTPDRLADPQIQAYLDPPVAKYVQDGVEVKDAPDATSPN